MGGGWTSRIIAGRYRLETMLGRGGFGEVWRAFDLLKGDRVAIKLCRIIDDARATLIRDEVTALQWVALPGVVRLRDDGTTDIDGVDGTHAFLVMDLVDGKPFPGVSAVPLAEITARLLEVLARLHGIGVVHGDLKPANVLVDAAGYPTVLDLGICRGMALRTPDEPIEFLTLQFAAPEQLREHRIDARSDLYSVGVMVDKALQARGESRDGPLAVFVVAVTREDPARRPSTAAAALALLGDEGRVDSPPPLASAPSATRLKRLFGGPEHFLHHRSEAARLLWARTGGQPAAMHRELRAWLRAGFAWRDGDRIMMRPEGLARLVEGYPVAIDHPMPVLPPDAADLLCWIRLAQPLAGVDRLRGIVPLSGQAFDAALAALVAAEAIWTLPDGTLGTWLLPDPAPDWQTEDLRAAHAALGASLAADSSAAVRHAIAADHTAPGLIERIALVGRRLVLEGRLREAHALLERGLDLARLRRSAADEARLLPICVLHALSDEGADALRHARYLIGRAMDRTLTMERLERLLSAAQAGTTKRASEQLAGMGDLADGDLERMAQLVILTNARREGIDAEERALAACATWAEADRATRWADYLCRLGKLRYRQGRYAEAAQLHVEAAQASTNRSGAMDALVSEAAAWLEALETERALARAQRVEMEARGLRHAWIEVNASFVERSARYRLGMAGRPRPDRVEAAALVSTAAEAMIAGIEAAIAWRAGDALLARSLASRAARRYEEEGHADGAMLFRAFAHHCGVSMESAELDAVLSAAQSCRTADFGVQAMGLLAFALPPERAQSAMRGLVGRGRPRSAWSQRLDVLSYDEALDLTGVSADTLTGGE